MVDDAAPLDPRTITTRDTHPMAEPGMACVAQVLGMTAAERLAYFDAMTDAERLNYGVHLVAVEELVRDGLMPQLSSVIHARVTDHGVCYSTLARQHASEDPAKKRVLWKLRQYGGQAWKPYAMQIKETQQLQAIAEDETRETEKTRAELRAAIVAHQASKKFFVEIAQSGMKVMPVPPSVVPTNGAGKPAKKKGQA